jgi:hypothetical protein
MTFGMVLDVPAPIELYDGLHAAVLRHGGDTPDGLLLHIGRATDSGFQIIEVWESREQFDRYNNEVVGPALAESAGRQPEGEPDFTEFEPRGLVVPAARVLV